MHLSNLIAHLSGERAEAGEKLAGTQKNTSPFMGLLSILKEFRQAQIPTEGISSQLESGGKEAKAPTQNGKSLPPDATLQAWLPLFLHQTPGAPMPPALKAAETAPIYHREPARTGEDPGSTLIQPHGIPVKAALLAAANPDFSSLNQAASRERSPFDPLMLESGPFSPSFAGALSLHPHVDPAPLSVAGVGGAMGNGHGAVDTLAQPVGTPAWERGLEQKVVWMLGREAQHASLQLNPPHLGPLEIHLKLKDDQASAVFLTPHEAVRDALEAALPRLRESMQSHGVHLSASWLAADAHGQFGAHQGQAGHAYTHGGRASFQGLVQDEPPAVVSVIEKRGLVNLFI